MTLNKCTFLQNPDCLVFYLNFVQNQVTALCNHLTWQVLKDHSSVSFLFLCVNTNVTSKICERGDANCRA